MRLGLPSEERLGLMFMPFLEMPNGFCFDLIKLAVTTPEHIVLAFIWNYSGLGHSFPNSCQYVSMLGTARRWVTAFQESSK